jgi:hypothetical protein
VLPALDHDGRHVNTFYGHLEIRKDWGGVGQRSAIEDCHRRYQESIELLEVAIRTPGSRYHVETGEPLDEGQVRTLQSAWRGQMQILEQEF